MSQISKSTLIPLGFVVFLLGFTYQVGNSQALIKSKIGYLERVDTQQSELIRELSKEIHELNINITKQSEIMKRLEEKIQD